MFDPCRLDLRPEDLISGGVDSIMVLADNGLQSNTQVVQQVPTISNMLGCGSPLAHTLAVDLRAVACDSLHLGVVAQPRGH